MKIVFEVDHLNNASPATVSRCGFVYMEPSILEKESFDSKTSSLNPHLTTWLKTLPEKVKSEPGISDKLQKLVEKLLNKGKLIRQKL